MAYYGRYDGNDYDPNSPGQLKFMSKRLSINCKIVDINVIKTISKTSPISYTIIVYIDLKETIRQESNEEHLVMSLLKVEKEVKEELTKKPTPTIVDKLKEIGYK